MGTKFPGVSVSGYNASPPADDGSTSASNQVLWATIKTKLADTLNTAIAAINSGLVTAFDYSARSISTGDSTIAGDHMRTIEIAPTVSSVVTVSLGDAATMAAGYTVNIVNRSNFTCVVGRSTASDTINGTAANDVALSLNSVIYKVNSTSNGYVTVARGGTVAGSLPAAVQSDQETGTSNAVAVTPGTQKYHPSAAKAWGLVTMSGSTPTLAANFNVSSVSDNGVGQFTFNFTVSFSSTAYAVAGFAKSGLADGRAVCSQGSAETRATGSCGLATANSSSGTYTDLDSFSAAFFGDQ